MYGSKRIVSFSDGLFSGANLLLVLGRVLSGIPSSKFSKAWFCRMITQTPQIGVLDQIRFGEIHGVSVTPEVFGFYQV